MTRSTPAGLGLLRTNFHTADPKALAAFKRALAAGVPPAVQDRMIREADALTPHNPFDVHTLQGSRLRRLVHPGPAAELLAHLAHLTVG